MQQKAVDQSCHADKECTSFNCLSNQVCGTSPSSPRQLATWVYIVIGTGIFGGKNERRSIHLVCIVHSTHNVTLGMFGTLVMLFFVHRRQRDDEREKRLQYWREQVKSGLPTGVRPDSPSSHLQNALRQNIMQMHDTAQASIFLNPGSSRRSALFGGSTEDSQAPILQYGGNTTSGLRQLVGEDVSFDGGNETEQLVMRTPFTHDNKI
jgi:hypothetical protein